MKKLKALLSIASCVAAMSLLGATKEEARQLIREFMEADQQLATHRPSYLTGGTVSINGQPVPEDYNSLEKQRERAEQDGQTLIDWEDYRLMEQKRSQAWSAIRGLGYDAFPALYEMLGEEFDNISCLYIASDIFFSVDGIHEFSANLGDLAAEGEEEALEWARKILGKDIQEEPWEMKRRKYDIRDWSSGYLAAKGKNKEDVELLRQKGSYGRDTFLATRVAGINVFESCNTDFGDFITVYPSVANTGPQGAYVREILVKAFGLTGGDVYEPNIPEELLAMVVSFDADGNPVCNVDLANYWLSMPVITPKPDKRYRGEYTVTFPHESEENEENQRNGKIQYKRMLAVWEMDDLALVADMAKNDEVYIVRQAATQRLRQLRRMETEQLDDQVRLAEMVKNEEDDMVRQAANDRLHQLRRREMERLRGEISSLSSRLRQLSHAELDHITDEALLARVARMDASDVVREVAAYRLQQVRRETVLCLNDQETLAEIAQNDNDDVIRSMAILKLHDQALLERIVKNDKGQRALQSAVSKLTNQELLQRLALYDRDDAVRQVAVSRLTDQTLLKAFAENDESDLVRGAAAWGLEDQALLEAFAKDDKSDRVRSAAVGRLEDQILLGAFAKDDRSDPVRHAAIRNLKDKALLEKLSKNDASEMIRQMAAYRLDFLRYEDVRQTDDQTLLAEYAKNDTFVGVRCEAVRKLDNQALLADIMANDPHEAVRQAAEKRLKELQGEE